jgi:bacterial/archaeal transporter family-2 protein
LVWVYLLVAVVAGAVLPLQVGVNAELSRWVNDPVRAAFVSFLVGTVALLIIAAFVRKPLPSISRLGDVPWWAWTGGLIGAFYVAASIVLGPKLGAATFIAAIVAGQAIASVVIDQYGWVGFKEHPATPGRVVGMVLVAGGVALVRFF